MVSRPVPDPIAPGQESVWDYPRPPALRKVDELVTVVLGGVEICETRESVQVLETSHPPTYYLPRTAFVPGSLRQAGGSSFCEWKGEASYLDVLGGGKVARNPGKLDRGGLRGRRARSRRGGRRSGPAGGRLLADQSRLRRPASPGAGFRASIPRTPQQAAGGRP